MGGYGSIVSISSQGGGGYEGVKLSDGKGFGGKGRLTDGKIDILQNYYGLVVRSNFDDVDKMATAIKAT